MKKFQRIVKQHTRGQVNSPVNSGACLNAWNLAPCMPIGHLDDGKRVSPLLPQEMLQELQRASGSPRVAKQGRVWKRCLEYYERCAT